MNLKKGCPFCFPDHEVDLEGLRWRLICTDEPDHYVLAPHEHVPCTSEGLSEHRDILLALFFVTWPMEIIIHLNGYHMSFEHLHIHVYRKA